MPDLWTDLLGTRRSLGEGRTDEPVRYEAIRHHEGRSIAMVAITARQSRGIVDLHARLRGSVDEVPATDLTLIGTALRSVDGLDQRGHGRALTCPTPSGFIGRFVHTVGCYCASTQEALLPFAS